MKKIKSYLATFAITGAMALSSIATLPVHAANYSAVMFNTYPNNLSANSSTIESNFELHNSSSSEFYLPQISFRYYFSNDGVAITNDNIETFCTSATTRDNSVTYSNVDVKVKTIKASQQTSQATHYIEVSFKATGNDAMDHLPADEVLKLTCGIRTNEGTFDITNDFSYFPQTNCNHLDPNSAIPVFWLDTPIWQSVYFDPQDSSYVQ